MFYGKMKLLFHWFIMVLAMVLKTNVFHVAELETEDTLCNRNKYEKNSQTICFPQKIVTALIRCNTNHFPFSHFPIQ